MESTLNACVGCTDGAKHEVLALREEISQLEESLRMYRHDELAGLLMRRDFNIKFFEYFNSGVDFYLAILDVNGLKKANTEKGYIAGDMLLKSIATNIVDSRVGMVYRIGGDEFAVLSVTEITCSEAKNIEFGIVSRNGFDTENEMFLAADSIVREKKKKLYAIDDRRK